MNKILSALLLLLCISANALAQTKETELKILEAPSSPASSLLGIAPSDVFKPTDVKSLSAYVRNSSNNFTTLPNAIAVDIAPKWLFEGTSKRTTLKDYMSNKPKHNISQSFVFSIAFKDDTTKAVNRSQLGVGIKFSLLRGNIIGDDKNRMDSMDKFSIEISDFLLKKSKKEDEIYKLEEKLSDTNKKIQELGAKGIEDTLLNKKQADINKKIISAKLRTVQVKSNLDSISKLQEDIKFTRYGCKWDFYAGTVIDFMNRDFNYSNVTKVGAWTVFGYEGKKGLSTLGIVRYLYNPDKLLADSLKAPKANLGTLDAGARLIYTNESKKASVSMEALYRSVIHGQNANDAFQIKPSWRFMFNAEYSVMDNVKLTYSFGKEFDNTITRGGNLVSFLSVFTSFGSNKKALQNTNTP